MAASMQAYTHFRKCSHASVGLAQARPNYQGDTKVIIVTAKVVKLINLT